MMNVKFATEIKIFKTKMSWAQKPQRKLDWNDNDFWHFKREELRKLLI